MSRPKQILSMLLLALLVGVPVGIAVAFFPRASNPLTNPVSRAEYAAAACEALDTAQPRFNRSGREITEAEIEWSLFAAASRARRTLEAGLPAPPTVYRDVHDATVRVLEAAADERYEDQQRERAILAGYLVALDAADLAVFTAVCGTLP